MHNKKEKIKPLHTKFLTIYKVDLILSILAQHMAWKFHGKYNQNMFYNQLQYQHQHKSHENLQLKLGLKGINNINISCLVDFL